MTSNDSQIIKGFYATSNPQRLPELSDNTKKFFIGTARYVMNYLMSYPTSRPDLALIVLKTLDPFNPACINNLNVTLSPLQKHVVEYFHYVKSLLVCLSTGCGKTLIALCIANCYLNQHPDHNVIVVSPATLLKNFHKEAEKFGVEIDNRYSFYSFQKFQQLDARNEKVNCQNSLLIVDEAHVLRNFAGKMYDAVMECSIKADKVLLLTATPIINATSDYLSLINLLYQNYIIGPERTQHVLDMIEKGGVNVLPNILRLTTPYKFKISQSRHSDVRDKIQIEELQKIKLFLAGRVIYKKKCMDENFPSYSTHVEYVNMSMSYLPKYEEAISKTDSNLLFSNPKVFWNGYRRAVNRLGPEYYSTKVREIAPKIRGKQSIIYSNWLEYGADILGNILTENGMSYGIISGDTPLKKRDDLVKRFNNGEISVLIITKAGAEGIDLKGVRNVVILDPAWSPAYFDQIIGRAVRYQSHTHLPFDERHVDVYLMQLKEPHITPDTLNLSHSGDIKLYQIVERKAKLMKESNAMLTELSTV